MSPEGANFEVHFYVPVINLFAPLSTMQFEAPSGEEVKVVASIKSRIQSESMLENSHTLTDIMVLRFLRGCKGDAKQANEKLIDHLKWRIEEKVDEIDSVQPKIQKFIDNKLAILGNYSLAGQSSSFCLTHRHNASDRDITELKLFIIWTLEYLRKSAKPDEERFTIVMDLSRFHLKCMDYEASKILITILQTHYPETLGTMLIVDAPMLFSACWAVIKMWIDPVTSAKVKFISRDKLQDFFSSDAIPDAVKNREV